MNSIRKERVIEFLREKQILGNDQTQWYVKFDSGRGEKNINDLFDEFGQREVNKLEDIEEINSLIGQYIQLVSLAPDEINCIKEVVISYARALRGKIERLQGEVDSWKNDLEVH